MNRRLVFGLVTVALLINLAVGAKIYLGNPPRKMTPPPSAKMSLPTRCKKSAANTLTARI